MASARSSGAIDNPESRTHSKAAPPFRFKDLPLELRRMICEFALTTESNTIYIFEEAGKLRPGVTSTGIMPVGGFRQAFASHHRHNVELPKPYNQLQYTCKELYKEVRGMEFQQNEIQCNGWTFDTFRSQLQTHPNQAAWYTNVRLVTLIGSFSIGHHADETLLHGILKFGETHPKAIIRVCVPTGSLTSISRDFLLLVIEFLKLFVEKLLPVGSKRIRV